MGKKYKIFLVAQGHLRKSVFQKLEVRFS